MSDTKVATIHDFGKVEGSNCAHCGEAFELVPKWRKYCLTCSDLCRKEQLPHQIQRRRDRAASAATAKRRRDGIPLFSGHTIACQRCNVAVLRTGAGQKYCEDCRLIAAKERDKRLDSARRRRNGRVSVGETRPCKYCSGDFIKVGIHQVYCSPKCKAAWWASNPQWVISRRMSAGIKISLSDSKKGRSWENLVGYSVVDLMHHLERQFLPGMTWCNRGAWHIDHITPLASFSFADANDPDFKAAWSLTNLRPLWAKDNIRKSAKRLFLI